MFDVKPIVQRLKSYGKEHDIKQGDLAKRLGVSGSTLSRWLNEKTSFNPTLNQLVSMAEMFGVSLIELLSQENNAAPAPAGKDDKDTGKKATKPAKKTQKASKAKASTKAKAASVSSSDEKKPSKKIVKTSAAKGTKAKKAASEEKAAKTERKATVKKAAKTSSTKTGRAKKPA